VKNHYLVDSGTGFAANSRAKEKKNMSKFDD